jgi:DNA repair photolyase
MRHCVRTKVLAHWETKKAAYRLTLADGTAINASADHRFLTDRGWQYVAAAGQGPHRRAYLTAGVKLIGIGRKTASLEPAPLYRQVYLCGMRRGPYRGVLLRPGGTLAASGQLNLAMAGAGMLDRGRSCRAEFAIAPHAAIAKLTDWRGLLPSEWLRGFIGGIFAAADPYRGWVGFADRDDGFADFVAEAFMRFGPASRNGARGEGSGVAALRLAMLDNLRRALRFFHPLDPGVSGRAVRSEAALAVVAIEPLGTLMPMYDITTGSGDFIANGVISHNCYARPAHSYVNLSPGLDFETKLFYKKNAAELLEKELSDKKYVCKSIALGTNTDPYQPIERTLKVTRSILEVLQRHRHPFTIVTKGHLIERDIDILADMARDNLTAVHVSVTSLDSDLKRILEPRTPSAAGRLHAIRSLHEAGVPVGVLVAPVIPAINDHEIEHILEAVAKAGAGSAGYVMLRLPYEVKDLFREWLARHYPLRAAHVMSLVNDIRGGRDNDPRFISRMTGSGAFAALVKRRFDVACRKFSLNATRSKPLDTSLFRPPELPGAQLVLSF